MIVKEYSPPVEKMYVLEVTQTELDMITAFFNQTDAADPEYQKILDSGWSTLRGDSVERYKITQDGEVTNLKIGL